MQNLLATLILAAEDGAEEASGTDLLLPVWNELIAGAIAFAIVFFFIWRLAGPAFNELMENRQQAIKGDLEAAEAAKSEAESLRNDYRQQLAGASEEAARIVEDARQAGESVKADIVAKAEAEADGVKSRAQEEIVAERDRAGADVKREVADLSLAVAEKVVGSSMDAGTQRALVDRYIEELGGAEG